MRKPTYTEEQIASIFDYIIKRIERDKWALRQALYMQISATKFYDWLDKYPGFRERYVRAVAERQQALFDDILEIADKPLRIEMEEKKAANVDIRAVDLINARKLQIDSRKWALAKMNPEKFGEKTQLKADIDYKQEVAPDLSNLTYEQLLKLSRSDTDRSPEGNGEE